MDNIIYLDNKKKNFNSIKTLTSDEIKKLEEIRDGIEKLLNTAAAVHREPLGVALAAARYSAMRLYELQGRAETMAFIDNCIQTVEISEDVDLNS